ncbi:EcsC family protein [Plantactinospora sp. B5E13]|uniref:EcsC family protein n=1 Tax=Plantactinospora sp. B5E13 TaxID=3153758 RepID=UPI00325DE360
MDQNAVVPVEMDEYDRRAWDQVQAWKERRLRRRARRWVPHRVRERVTAVGARVRDGVRAMPGAARFDVIFSEALEGLSQHGSHLAVASLRTEAILRAHRAAGHEVRQLADIRQLRLSEIDQVKPNLALAYATAGTVEGAGAGLAVTGGELLTVTGAGPALVIGAVVADVAVMLMGGLRLVAHTAAYYGYDTSSEDEMAVALGILGVGTAVGTANKVAAYRELSLVTQRMLQHRGAKRVWETLTGRAILPKSPVTELVTRVLKQFGFKVTTRNVQKLVPMVGVAIGAGQNALILHRVAESADRLYRERWLRERYGLEVDVPDPVEGGEAVSIVEIMDGQRDRPDSA